MTPLAWEVAEVTALGASLASGAALEEARGAGRAQEAGPAQIGILANQKGAYAEKALHQCCQFCPGASWIREFCLTPGGARHLFVRTALGMFLLLTISSRGPGEMKESRVAEDLVGEQRHQHLLRNHLEVTPQSFSLFGRFSA